MTDNLTEKPTLLSIGEQLRTAREAQGLSIEDVARQLLLSRQLIGEIENDDYRRIAAPVYIKGYLRSYAQLLKIPVDAALLKNFKHTARVESETNRKTMPNMTKPKAEGKANFFGYVVVAVFVLLALLWWRAARVHTEITPAAINNAMTEIQLPSAQSQQPSSVSQPVVPPQINSPGAASPNATPAE